MVTHGELDDGDDDDAGATELFAAARLSSSSGSELVIQRLIGTGPWAWQGVGPIGFFAEGHLHTPWWRGSWGPHSSVRGAIYANFVGEKHAVVFDESVAIGALTIATTKVDVLVPAPQGEDPSSPRLPPPCHAVWDALDQGERALGGGPK